METQKKHSEEVAELNEQIDKVFNELPELLQTSILEAIDRLLLVEKKARLLLEPTITIRITDKMLDLCYETNNMEKLNSSIILLCKRRSQHDDVIAAIIRKGKSYLPSINDYDTKMKLIEVLLDQSEGKMFIEGERARLIREKMRMLEEHGDLEGAAKASQEIQVEVCNALSNREKAEFLLEQIRLCQVVEDWVRIPITIQKVNVKLLQEEKMDDLTQQYIHLCIVQHRHDNAPEELYRDFQRSYQIALRDDNDPQAIEYLQAMSIFLVLSPYTPAFQHQITQLLLENSRLWKYIPDYKSFLVSFEKNELRSWPLASLQSIFANPLFTDEAWGELRSVWKDTLRKRVIEHNIRVMGLFFTEATLARIAELLQLSEAEAEEALAAVRIQGQLWLQINRVEGTVNFKEPQPAEAILTQWSDEVKSVMDNLNRIVYLIEKDKMIKEVSM